MLQGLRQTAKTFVSLRGAEIPRSQVQNPVRLLRLPLRDKLPRNDQALGAAGGDAEPVSAVRPRVVRDAHILCSSLRPAHQALTLSGEP